MLIKNNNQNLIEKLCHLLPNGFSSISSASLLDWKSNLFPLFPGRYVVMNSDQGYLLSIEVQSWMKVVHNTSDSTCVTPGCHLFLQKNFIFLAKNRKILSFFFSFFLPMQRLMSFLPNYGISIQIHLNLGQKRTRISLLTFCGHTLCMQYLSIIRMTIFLPRFLPHSRCQDQFANFIHS